MEKECQEPQNNGLGRPSRREDLVPKQKYSPCPGEGDPYKVSPVGFLSCYVLGSAVLPSIFHNPNGSIYCSYHGPIIPTYTGCVYSRGRGEQVAVQIVFSFPRLRIMRKPIQTNVENYVYHLEILILQASRCLAGTLGMGSLGRR